LGPLLCVLGVPLVGAWSDACTSRLGRRRPFLLGIGALLALSLAGVAYGESLRNVMGANAHRAILATSTVLLDFASQALLNPCQALVCDLVPDVDFGFAVYSFALSLGGVLGYLLSGLDWTNTALGQAGQERAVFLLLLSVFTACLALNLLKSQESPGRHPNGLVQHLRKTHWHKMSTKDVVRTALSAALLFVCNAFCNVFITFPSWLASCLRLDVLTSVPGPLRTLFVFQLLAWMAVMSHYVYFTDFAGEVLFHGRPEQTASLADRLLYDRGVRAGSWGLLVNCVACELYYSQKRSPAFSVSALYTAMGSFALAMPGLLLFTNVGALLTLSAVTGLASAALDSIPYSLIRRREAEDSSLRLEDYFQGAKHQPGVGQCLAVLDTAEYLAQVLLSMFMGYTIYATGTVASYVCVSTLCAVAACYACSRVACPPRTKNVGLYP
ncbi:sucrose transport protein, putative, partial [Ixodes scapularis]